MELGSPGNCRAGAEHIIIFALDGVEDFETAAAEEIEIDRQIAVDHVDEGQALVEEATRIVDFVLQERAEFGRRNSLLDCRVGYAKALHVVLRKVDAVFQEIYADVLPEVREL